MKCPECGEELPDYMSYCSHCGALIDDMNSKNYGLVLTYAAFGKRLAAIIIDGFFLAIVVGLILIYIGIKIGITPSLILCWLYFSYMESSIHQGTVGKKLMGIKVTDLKLEKITFGKASLRFLCKILSILTLGIGFIISIFSNTKQTLHDKIAKTYVLYENKLNKERLENL